MPYEHREMTGTLFQNGYKQKPNQPDMKGEVMINGTLMEIAGWKKEGKNGEFLSLKISEKIKVKASDLPPVPEDDGLPFQGGDMSYNRVEVFSNGRVFWRNEKGELNREDGPAIYNEKAGYKEFWLNGKNYSEEEYWEKLKPTKKEIT